MTIAKSKISYCDYTVNPVTGCSPMGVGCDHCFAKGIVTRFSKNFGRTKADGFEPRYHPNWTEKLAQIKKPSTVFVAPLGDLFHNDFYGDVSPVIPCAETIWAITKNMKHQYLLLTKRYGRMAESAKAITHLYRENLPNIWWGMSVWGQKSYDLAIASMRNMPRETKLWLSIEPMITPIVSFDYLPCISQVIVGGESGAGARSMPLDWVRTIRNACAESGTPFYFKQYSRNQDLLLDHMPVNNDDGLPYLDGRTHAELAWRKGAKE